MTAKELITEAGLQNTHWGETIIAREELGCFDQRSRVESRGFTINRFKGHRHSIRVNPDGEPVDVLLALHNNRFARRVGSDRFVDAAKSLIVFEKRAAELVARGEA